ncbi:hypothetical protein XELAEV_18023646mg [Xenopus laevis]|uniref:Mitochondrial import receptor subunit TOM22 homolog n=1 Tax=Xenopus laevis TaxID=8355 RepID=A0A974D4I4_XENLA|nr:hypothetical protein XELAEV_18023646mg [Xenopus laevis]
MPLFGSTFSPKKVPPRKSASLSNLHALDRTTKEVELGLDYGSPSINIAGQSLKFENGQWMTESGGTGSQREVQRLRKRNQQLEEENNLLRVKVDLLLDMLEETLSERLWGLTEMFPESLRTVAGVSLNFSVGASKKLYSFSRSALWIGMTSFMILVLPVVFETEKLQMEQQQQLQQRQILLGPSTGMSGPLPPLPGKV